MCVDHGVYAVGLWGTRCGSVVLHILTCDCDTICFSDSQGAYIDLSGEPRYMEQQDVFYWWTSIFGTTRCNLLVNLDVWNKKVYFIGEPQYLEQQGAFCIIMGSNF